MAHIRLFIIVVVAVISFYIKIIATPAVRPESSAEQLERLMTESDVQPEYVRTTTERDPRRAGGEPWTRICFSYEGCAWEVYNDVTTEFQYHIAAVCHCGPGYKCIRTGHYGPLNYIFKCRQNTTDDDFELPAIHL